MKRLFVFCMLVVISSSQINAVIVTGDFIKTAGPEFAGKKFVFYGDLHERRDEDNDQRKTFIQNVVKRDQESPEQLHILIEQPVGTTLNSSVMSTLPRLLPPCRYTKVKNVEMRCHLAAACEVLDPQRDPLTILPTTPCSSAYDTCQFGDTTIGSIDHEVDHFKQQIDEWTASAPPLLANAMRADEALFQYQRQRYKAICAALSLVPETWLFSLSQNLYSTNQVARNSLFRSVEDLGSTLFGMHLCKTMMTLKEPSFIALISGAWHTRQARSFFATCNEKVAHYGKDWEPPIKSLPLKYLDLKTGFKSAECCTVQ